MRFGRFESAGHAPLGEGVEKKVYENPANEDRVIAEVKKDDEGKERYSVRQLKGSYYLTKIAHLLLPKRVPDIYQAGQVKD